MIVIKLVKLFFMFPIWVVQLMTGSKSFLDNPLIGSQRLNRLGLHKKRVQLAGAICAWRRRRLAKRVRSDWREAFDRDGFVAIHDFVAPDTFQALRRAILEYRGQAREMRQGDAVTRRLAIDPAMLAAIPELRRQLDRDDLKALFHYVASFRVTPLHYVQTIVTHDAEVDVDPQEALHADAFHSSLKAWLFLNPVAPDEAPFTYVRGSHRLTAERLDWEYRRSLIAPGEMSRLTGRGSPRVNQEELAAMGLGEGEPLAVPGNTLVVADTLGFHARGASVRPIERVEIWSYARRNPFLPWLGGDLLSIRGLAERRVGWVWAARDHLANKIGQPWQPVGLRSPTSDSSDI